MKTKEIIENVQKVIVGNDDTITLLLTALLAEGHVLLEDVPGTGKTMIAKAMAKSIGGDFSRIQFTPDLLPTDITGMYYYSKKTEDFIFRAGPAFANIILADELNRATPRTQSALLECMGEKQITIEGNTHTLSDPFFVIATENPVESSGTFPLPEAQLDRFIMRLSMEKLSREQSLAVLDRYNESNPLVTLSPVCTAGDVSAMRNEAAKVSVSPLLKNYIMDIIDAAGKQPEVSAGISTRAAITMLKASKAYAYVNGRTYVVPEDIKFLAPKVLAHRLLLNHGSKWDTARSEAIIARAMDLVAAPTENFN